MSESDKPQLRQITREDIEFLAALQDEMNTQPRQCQADPRFWVVLTHEYREAWEGADRIDRVTLVDDNGEALESLTPSRAVLAAMDAGTKGYEWLGFREYIERWCDDTGRRAIFETKKVRIAENTRVSHASRSQGAHQAQRLPLYRPAHLRHDGVALSASRAALQDSARGRFQAAFGSVER